MKWCNFYNVQEEKLGKKCLYMSGKISGLDRREVLYRFSRCELWLRHQNPGVRIVNPTRVWCFRWPWLYRLLERIFGNDTAYELVLLYDLWLLSHCQRLHLIGTDWSTSRGSKTEMGFAQAKGIDVTVDVTAKTNKK